MTAEELHRALARGQLQPAYLFTGPEAQLKQQAIDALIATVPEAARPFNVQVFHAFEADLAEVLGAARSLPFLGARRVVVLRDVEKMRQTEGRDAALAEYLERPAPETVLVVTTDDDERAKALAKKHGERLATVAFRPPTGAALAAAVRAEAGRLGCAIDAGAVAALIGAVGEDRARLFGELEKLRLAVGAGGRIDVAAVERYAAGYAHHRTFDVVDAVGRRDLPAALRLLRESPIREEEFLGLLGQLGKRLRVLWYLAGGARAVPPEFRVYPNQLDRLRAEARNFTRAEIERGLLELARLDEAVKSTAVPPKLLLERFLLAVLPRG